MFESHVIDEGLTFMESSVSLHQVEIVDFIVSKTIPSTVESLVVLIIAFWFFVRNR